MNMINMKDTNLDLFAFFEMTPDLVCIAGKDGFLKMVNPAVVDKFGYTKEELYAVPISSFIHPEDRDLTHTRRTELLSGKVLHNFANRYLAKDGKIVWLEWTSVYLADKEIVFAIAKDISGKKQTEREGEEKYNKFKNLATHFKSSIEKDRKYFAYELHEELAQLVAALKMDVDWIAVNTPGLQGSAKNRVENALTVSKMLIKTIQRISFSISPNMLDEFGLNATLEWLSKEFSILNTIPCSFESAYDEESLTKEMKVDFFRICQEALTNVLNLSQAKNLVIRIEDVDDHIQLSINDKGDGFTALEEKQNTGIINIRERAASINGRLVVQPVNTAGTGMSIMVDKQYDTADQ